jgi:hypothetical protein
MCYPRTNDVCIVSNELPNIQSKYLQAKREMENMEGQKSKGKVELFTLNEDVNKMKKQSETYQSSLEYQNKTFAHCLNYSVPNFYFPYGLFLLTLLHQIKYLGLEGNYPLYFSSVTPPMLVFYSF